MQAKPNAIAIDGTAGSGKSALGRRLADKLDYLYLDTGVMYRAVTWAVLERGIDPDAETAVGELAATLNISIQPPHIDDSRDATIRVDGQDVTWEIRSPAVAGAVSLISSYARVRQTLTTRQRAMAQSGKIVMVGRDIGTVVLPNAPLKIFLEASIEVRAKRRYKDMQAQGKNGSFDELLAAMTRRDKLDRERPISPMVPANDAVIIHTDDLSLPQVLDRVETLLV